MDERVLFAEDDASLRESTTLHLSRAGWKVVAVGDGADALSRFAGDHFDLVVLDVMLPSIDGFEICREIRRHSQIPIVMLTARSDTTDVVVGLELGADDYVTKPFQPAELVARLRAALRRAQRGHDDDIVRIGGLEIDPAAFRVKAGGEVVDLTATEFRLLLELVQQRGRVLSRELLLERVWDYDYLGDSRLVDMAMKRLRDKIGDDPRSPRYISTVRGVGYRFDGS